MRMTMPWTTRVEMPKNGATSKLDEIRRALSHEATQIASLASQLGRDAAGQAGHAAEHARHATQDAASQAASQTPSVTRAVVASAGGMARRLLTSGRHNLSGLGDDARKTRRQLANVRITTEAKKSGPDLKPGITMLTGFGAGVSLMYFFDPRRGNQRRALLRDRISRWTRTTRETIEARRAARQASGSDDHSVPGTEHQTAQRANGTATVGTELAETTLVGVEVG